MPRQARKKSESGIYHVMFRAVNQQQIFEDGEDFERFIQILTDCKAISGYKLFTYCLMGNHIHLLIQEGKEPIEQVMKRIATRFVYWYNIKYRRAGHLFQDRFKSEPVEDDAYFATAVRYIHQNPVKAGLCKKISDYPFSSYKAFFDDSDLIDREFVFEIIPQDVFQEFNNKTANDRCLEIEDNPVVRVTDEQAQRIIYKYTKCRSVSEFQILDFKQRDKCIVKLKERGLSIRQISRLTGVSFGIVRKFFNT